MKEVIIYPDGSYCADGQYGNDGRRLLAAFGLTQHTSQTNREDENAVIKRVNGTKFKIFGKRSIFMEAQSERISRSKLTSEVMRALREETRKRHNEIRARFAAMKGDEATIAQLSLEFCLSPRYVRQICLNQVE
jgi:hypothetical protein